MTTPGSMTWAREPRPPVLVAARLICRRHGGKVSRSTRWLNPMNPNGMVKSLLCAATAAWLLASCVTILIEPGHGETDDLAVVVADARRMAGAVGAGRVLVVFDIDNTLLAMEQDLGSDQWYEWQKRRAAEDACDPRVVGDRLAVQGALYFAGVMRPTQEDAPALVRQIQDAGVAVIALTSRGVDYRLHTFRELRRNGYDFRRSAIGPASGWPDNFIPDNGIRPARYEDGVLLTTGQHKGAMLQELLRRTGAPLPRVVVMADDKQENLEAVAGTLASLGVPVRGWRYFGEDARAGAFDAGLSHAKWQQLEPALRVIQQVLGAGHFDLPWAAARPECD